MEKIYVGIVLYYPDEDFLQRNIMRLCKLNVNIVLVNNTPEIRYSYLNNYKNITVIDNFANKGVAKAFNQILLCAHDNGAKWAVTFDQDSLIPENIVDEYAKLIEIANMKIGAICPLIRYQDGELATVPTTSNIRYKKVQSCISSGCMINVDAWEAVGGFDEKLFIDFVDFDFCYSLVENGFCIIESELVILNHSLGELHPKILLGKKIMVTNHSSIRKYYFVRNSIICHYKHKKLYTINRCASYILKCYLKTLLYEKEKVKKICAMNNGLIDGFNYINRKH